MLYFFKKISFEGKINISHKYCEEGIIIIIPTRNIRGLVFRIFSVFNIFFYDRKILLYYNINYNISSFMLFIP